MDPRELPAQICRTDAAAQRAWEDGRKPPPASVRLPRIRRQGAADLDAVEYPLIGFPWEPWTLTIPGRRLTQAQAVTYADWLNDVEPGRLAVIAAALAAAGAPPGGLRERPENLAGLGGWIQQWFRLFAPRLMRGFFHDDKSDRLGQAWAAWGPTISGYSRYGDALLSSLAHDLAFLVADCARAVRPDLRWQAAFDTFRRDHLAVLDPDPPHAELVGQAKEFLVTSLTHPRGTRGRQLLRWHGQALYRCYQRAAAGITPPVAEEEFPDFRDRMAGRYKLTRPRRSDPAAPPELVEAVTAFRQAGWFETTRLEAPDLARAARAAWQELEREDIPLTPDQMSWRLLLLDTGRTWSEDVDAGVRPGDGIHETTLHAIEKIGGKGFGGFCDAVEDWGSRPGDVLLSFGWRRRKHRLLITAPGQYLSPALITGLNSMLREGGARLWFLDHGPPMGIVTRATAGERAALEQLTGIRLDCDPPGWWTSLAPLPPAQEAGPPLRPAAARPSASRSRKRAAAQPAVTAQQVFKQLMTDLIAPPLRELGFKGSARGFWYASGDYLGSVWTQKSRSSSKASVDFTVHLAAGHTPTGTSYWNTSLAALIPGHDACWWTVEAGRAPEPVAQEVLAAFHAYGWPAIQAALDSPGFPPDPAVSWARTFPPVPSAAVRRDGQPDLGPLAWVLRGGHRDNDELFAELADEDPGIRFSALHLIGQQASGDPRARPALLNRLAGDPDASVRRWAAHGLIPSARQAGVRDALAAAAAQDEDLEVRWAARYALRLALGGAARPGD